MYSRTKKTWRLSVNSITLSFLVTLYLIIFNNNAFWRRSSELLSTYNIASLFIFLFCIIFALCVTVSAKYVAKPVFTFLIITAASASWFVDRFGTIIDVEMLQSVADTTPAEAGHLISFGFIVHLALFGVIPALLVAWVKIVHRPIDAKIRQNSAYIFGALLMAVAVFLSQAGPFTSLGREHRDWIAKLNPVMPIGNAVKLALRASKSKNIVVKPIGMDAKVAEDITKRRKPRILIVVAGETARAESFSLNGYTRNTNPELARENIFYFSKTSSCGTITAVSLPCMFSPYTRSDYSHQKGLETENLLDVLVHAGIQVDWWENNTGHKGLADRTGSQSVSPSQYPGYCKNGECQDGVFLERIHEYLKNVKQDTVLVLHQLGSHGPAYYLRYPEEFRRFTPDCRTSDFAKCTKQEIVNSYDNTIAYTDHVLASLIQKLRPHQDAVETSLVYMSDHGESLGEFGIYLHGAPYFMAPSQQTHVPYLIWLGDNKLSGKQDACIRRATTSSQSHDNLFHTVLGLMHVETDVYLPDLDTLSSCRSEEPK
ncbi:phosphoethanolamine transferase [Brucella pseudogrignonensis]|uniref:phosphoethanolamine transferase n=1 Tax=Brucella pseudogrignonensis TaxID=419475 RepID=UPI0038D0758D